MLCFMNFNIYSISYYQLSLPIYRKETNILHYIRLFIQSKIPIYASLRKTMHYINIEFIEFNANVMIIFTPTV